MAALLVTPVGILQPTSILALDNDLAVQLLFGIRKASHLKFVVAFAALENHLSVEPAQEPWAHNLLFLHPGVRASHRVVAGLNGYLASRDHSVLGSCGRARGVGTDSFRLSLYSAWINNSKPRLSFEEPQHSSWKIRLKRKP